jgi:hypothetical protein
MRREGGSVTYAYVQDVASSWDQYERAAARLVDPPPEGLVVHVAGPTDDGVRIIDIWESEEAWERFRAERLAPAIAALGGPSRPEPTFRDVRPRHVVVPDRIVSRPWDEERRER